MNVGTVAAAVPAPESELVESLLEQFVAELDMSVEEFASLVGRSGAENRDTLLQVSMARGASYHSKSP